VSLFFILVKMGIGILSFRLQIYYFFATQKRKVGFSFAFPSFFCNFVRILSFSLYKGSLGD